MSCAIIIFGAAVHADGTPSPSLHRRTLYGLEAAKRIPQAPIFCSGGAGERGPSEAFVMRQILVDSGLAPERLYLDEESRDTLANVLAAARFMQRAGLERAVICTDSYHAPRVAMMFRALGVSTEPGPVSPGRGRVPLAHWAFMHAREIIAYAYDFMVMMRRRRALRATVSGA